EAIDAEALAERLGIARRAKGDHAKRGRAKALAIHDKQLIVYRYSHDNIFRDRGGEIVERFEGTNAAFGEQPGSTLPRLPLPPVPRSLKEGAHYVCLKVDFRVDVPAFGGRLNWLAILEVRTLAAIYLRPFVDDVT